MCFSVGKIPNKVYLGGNRWHGPTRFVLRLKFGETIWFVIRSIWILITLDFSSVLQKQVNNWQFESVHFQLFACLGKMLLKQVYEDKDGDEFYCVKFTTLRSIGKDGQVNEHRVLVCAGLRGVIRMIDVWRGKNIDSISPAATNSINDMALHPAFPEIVACASKDLSIHVWNLATSVQVFTLCSR